MSTSSCFESISRYWLLESFCGQWLSSRSGDDAGEFKGSITGLALVGTSIATVARRLTERATRGGPTQEWYPDTQGNMMKLSTEELIGNVRLFVQHQTGDEIIPGYGGEMTHLVLVPFTSEWQPCVHGDTFRGYTCHSLLAVKDYRICCIGLEKEFERIVKPTFELVPEYSSLK